MSDIKIRGVVNSIYLTYQEGSSDKFYDIAIMSEGDGTFSVPFTYGRRGTTGQSGSKATKVSLEVATKAYDSVVREKTGKGYITGNGTSQYGGTHLAPGAAAPAIAPQTKTASGYHPQLLNDITNNPSLMQTFIEDDDWIAQQKFDGKHMMLHKGITHQTAINKKGIEIVIPGEYVGDMALLPMHTLLDGESIGKTYFVFDILWYNGTDMRTATYAQRHHALIGLFGSTKPAFTNFKMASVAVGKKEKQELFDKVKASGHEGIVFKRLAATYKPGRPAAGGDMFKFKFKARVSCVVIRDNVKNSVGLGLINDDTGDIVDVGNVTIPVGSTKTFEGKSFVVTKPANGAIISCEYLYAYRGGSLYQPVFLGVRDDDDTDFMSILKYKPESEDTEEEVA